MFAKQDVLTLAFVTLNLILLYHILLEVYLYLILMVAGYLGYSYMRKTVTDNLDMRGKCVLITGCDTVKYKPLVDNLFDQSSPRHAYGIGDHGNPRSDVIERSRFGHDLAVELDSQGCTVYAGCLLPDGDGAKQLRELNSSRMHVLHLDVTNDSHATDAVQCVERQNKGLWAVVNNAAIERVGDIELVSIQQMKRVAEVNFYGMVRVTKAFIPMIRKSKGRIVNVTSVKGRLAVPHDVSYVVTKYAGEAFSDILRREMHKFDVKVAIIEPGHFGGATAMLDKKDCDIVEAELKELWKNYSPEVQAVYGWEYLGDIIQGCREIGAGGCQSTTAVTSAMVDAVFSRSPKCRYLIHGGRHSVDKWAVLPVLNSYLPEEWLDFIMRQLDPPPKLAAERK